VKVCVPSYLVPGTWLENLIAVRPLDWIEGVELLFFAWDEDARSILGAEREAIARLAGRFSYSLHLPDPLRPEDEELVALTRDFVGLYVIHPPRAASAEIWAGMVESWRSRYGDDFLLEYCGAEDFAAAERALPGLPLCPDAGRLARDGIATAEWIAARGSRVRELHLHRAAGGKDHLPLVAGEPWLEDLAPFLAGFGGRVELELFSLEGAESSRRALEAALAPPLAAPGGIR
jgi:hypothetical protein